MENNEFNLQRELSNKLGSILTEAFDNFAKDSYNNPMYKFLGVCVENKKSEIMAIYEKLLTETLASDDFINELRCQVSKKIAQAVVAQSQSVIDRSVEALKQDATFKAKLTLAIDKLISEVNSK